MDLFFRHPLVTDYPECVFRAHCVIYLLMMFLWALFTWLSSLITPWGRVKCFELNVKCVFSCHLTWGPRASRIR